MHRTLDKNRLYKASDCWDSDFVFDKVEKWLGWNDNLLDVLTRKLSQALKSFAPKKHANWPAGLVLYQQ
jgi:hypothetical protein